MNRPADRNLLFGILAVQMDFITREALIGAMQAWLLDKEKPLGQILIERGDLPQTKRDLLEPLVSAHVAQHHGDPAQSLAALSSVSDIVAGLSQVQDDEVQQTLSHLRPRRANTAESIAALSAEASQTTQQRFELLRAHAEGGLGKVWIAKDRELNREVAFKEIKPSHAQDVGSRGRFVLEAEITGGLEHPGIVPIYSLGHHDNGRPFYAMRFIRGDSLKEAVQKFHSPAKAPAPKSDPNAPTVIGQNPVQDPVAAVARPWDEVHEEDANKTDTGSPRSGERGYASFEAFASVEFRQLLGRFVDVCNAIEYAHSRGVLHRDLKPGNIMLGKYGETLVVDWGLAKATGKADQFAEAEEPVLLPSSGSGVEPTQIGSAIGTPAYMSPEQAAGRLDELGPATDVYSLGATLYHVLTGQPPLRKSAKLPLAELLARVQRGEFPTPREINPQIPKPLQAICLKAMSLRRSDRYELTSSLAADVERYLADEPVSAHAEPLTIRARRWVKRHQTLVGSTAAAVLVATVSLSVLMVVVAGKNVALESANTSIVRANTQLAKANTDLEAANASERAAKDEADQKRIAADKARDETKQVLDYLVAAFRKSDPDVDGETLTVAALFGQAVEQLDATFPNQPLIQAQLLNAIGQTYHGLGLYRKSIAIHERASDLRRNELGDEHVDTLRSINNLAMAYEGVGEFSEAIRLLEQTLELLKTKLGSKHADTLMSMSNLGVAYWSAGTLDQALPLFEQSLELRMATLGLMHPDTLQSMNNLAEAYQSVGRLPEALPLHEQALKLSKAKFGPQHPATLTSMNNLAAAYKVVGRLAEALTLFEKMLEPMKSKFGPDHPKTLAVMNNLALVYQNSGRWAEALPLHEKTLALTKAKLGPEHPLTLQSMNNLAAAYQSTGRLPDALLLHEHVLKLRKAKLGPEHPDTLQSMNNLSGAYYSAGRLAEALPLLKQTLEVRKVKLGLEHPDTFNSMNNLAIAFWVAGLPDEALPLFENLLEQQMAKLGPEHSDTLTTMINLAKAYIATEHKEKALPLYEQYFASHRRRATPDDLTFAGMLASVSHDLLQHRQYLPAEKYLRECLTIREKKLPDDWILFNTKSMLGGALAGQKKFQEAEPLLIDSYSEMKDREAKIPPAAKLRLNEAVQRVVDFYTSWEKSEEAAKWRSKLEISKPDSQMSKLATGDWDTLLKVDAKALPDLLALRATEMLKRGELANAVQAANKLREWTPKDKNNLYNAACVYARCAEFVTKDKPAPTDVEQAERLKFLNLALDTLKQSLAAGWDDFAHIRKDDDLKPLRGLPEFEALFPK
jgi:serine/threonine protein kinase